MAVIGGILGYYILRAISPTEPRGMSGGAYGSQNKLETLLGACLWTDIRDKRVIDFGCGPGVEAVQMAQRGAKYVYGIDTNERWLGIARDYARRAAVQNVEFAATPPEPADIIISLDAFEHFADPHHILQIMSEMLRPGGYVLAAFGPTWYHPLGGHLFSVFPWAHLIFSEQSLCRWRSHIRNDGAQRFSEVEGGLNKMTIRRFEHLVAQSPFRLEYLETVPIRASRRFHNHFTREFLTAIVRCKLVPRPK